MRVATAPGFAELTEASAAGDASAEGAVELGPRGSVLLCSRSGIPLTGATTGQACDRVRRQVR